MVTVSVSGPPGERIRVLSAIQTALNGSRFVVRRYGLDVTPDPLDLHQQTTMDVTLLERTR